LYLRLLFIKNFQKNAGQQQTPSESEPVIVSCPNCGSRNRIAKHAEHLISKCGNCGSNLFAGYSRAPGKEWEERTLCGDTGCVGVIGDDGRCGVCGRTFTEGKKAEEFRADQQANAMRESLLKQRKGEKFFRICVGIVVSFVIFAAIALNIGEDKQAGKPKGKPGQIGLSEKAKQRDYGSQPAGKSSPLLDGKPPKPLVQRTLPNGTIIRKTFLLGDGRLTVDNGLSTDAAAKLIDIENDTCIVYFYIAAKSKFTLKGISDGEYRLLFCRGHDWDQKKGLFTRDIAFFDFNKRLRFDTKTQVQDNRVYTEYSEVEITLHPVVRGNVATQQIDDSAFTKY
jgi:ribosomal protein S27E